jgi:hypothetical protein
MQPIARISSTKFNRKDGFTLGVNIWLQLGWASPCEVTKNLVDLVPLVLGHGVIQPFQWLMSTHTGSPKPPKTETYPKIENRMNLDYMQKEYPSALFCT